MLESFSRGRTKNYAAIGHAGESFTWTYSPTLVAKNTCEEKIARTNAAGQVTYITLYP